MLKLAPKFAVLGICVVAFFNTASAQADRDKAIEHFRLGDFDAAIKILEGLHGNGKADYPSAIYLGAAFVKVGEKDKAAAIFKNMPMPTPSTSIKYDKEVKITKRPFAKFSEHVSENERSGFIRMAVELKDDGSIGFVFPFIGTSKNFIKPGVDAAQAIKFKPAILNGRPVSVVIIIEYTLN